MHHPARRMFPYLVAVLAVGSLAWAVTFGTLPEADFSFNNGDEVKTVDPAKAEGSPEHRILEALYEGLLRQTPIADEPEDGLMPMAPRQGVAEYPPEVSEDGKTYTFKIRPEARWSNGRPMTAHDFVWSWRRTLHPETASQYSYQLHYLAGAQAYNQAAVEIGDRVEVEYGPRKFDLQPFPRGTMAHGVLREIIKSPEPQFAEGTPEEEKADPLADWKRTWVYRVEVKPERDGEIQWSEPGEERRFAKEVSPLASAPPMKIRQILPHFESTVGAEAVDDRTLVVTLDSPTPFFEHLVAFYTLYPVNRECVEEHGPGWVKPENIVGNGPYLLKARRLRDRIRLVKNPHYWGADEVSLEVIDAFPVKSETTALNMYLEGQLDWIITVPNTIIPILKERPDFKAAPALITYFYRLNVDRPPLDDVLVRRALNAAMNKQEIVDQVTRAGQLPARGLVPPGMTGYEGAECGEYDVGEARRLLAEAGYPGGRGLPTVEILYNTSEGHRAIAEVIQQQWKQNLGINVELRNLEWGVYLDTVTNTRFQVARAGWIADYPDPNTFLDMFVTDGPQNNTNWSNPEYDDLIEQAAREVNPQRRMQILQDAEQILMDELPIIPIYFYVTTHMVKPHVHGFHPNVQDDHPLHRLRVEKKE
jgi:oligopeptide transport system substrate-binding protein